MTYAADPQEFIDVTQDGISQRAVQPFGPDSPAYVDPEELEYPEHNLERAKELTAKYKEETGEDLTFSILSTTAPETVALAQLAQSQLEAAGMSVTIDQVEQTQLINTALGGDFQAVLWRNHPGGDPGTQYVWWYSVTEAGAPNFVNFSKINDPEIDKVFKDGRANTDLGGAWRELPGALAGVREGDVQHLGLVHDLGVRSGQRRARPVPAAEPRR